jgi:hypothetical protein
MVNIFSQAPIFRIFFIKHRYLCDVSVEKSQFIFVFKLKYFIGGTFENSNHRSYDYFI